eukprot:5174338-Ditylum_brightwellii.AAC.1
MSPDTSFRHLSNILLLDSMMSSVVPQIHDKAPKLFELGSNQWFGHVVGPHLICWPVNDVHFVA